MATYLPEFFSGAAKIANYIGDYSGKTSDCINQAKHEDKNLVVYALGTIFSAVTAIATVGSFASEQVYKNIARPLGDCVSSNLKNIHNAEGYRHIQTMMKGCSQ